MFVQFLAAVPWLLVLTIHPKQEPGSNLAPPGPSPLRALGIALALALGSGLIGGFLLDGSRDIDLLDLVGKAYGSVLYLQVQIDLFVAVFALLAWLWPKGAAVARAAFREGYRQPMFWLLVLLAFALMFLFPFIPYFTFGEDYIMMKELGFDTIILVGSAFGVLAAATSISEEIEGRTAVTLMSKPVSRRQFLLGKFVGIFLCSALLVASLGWFFALVMLYKRWFDRMEPLALPTGLGNWIDSLALSSDTHDLVRSIALWCVHVGEVLPGLVMASALVMILVAVAVSLATRLPMIVNLIVCLGVYMLANLAPTLVLSTTPEDPARAGAVQKLLHFTAQVFETILPGLELFRVRPTLVDESTLPLDQYWQHVGAVSLYGVIFTAIVLLVGLVLFEDRDLA